jgi:L-2,4-diaminobutyrate decarboxylase
MKPLADVISELVGMFDGMPNWNHPRTMVNVVPPANTAAIIGSTLAGIFSPNILEGDYSWNVARSEIEAAAMVAGLIGWDARTAGGVFTFGGSGCYLYGIKLALTAVLGKETRWTGIPQDGQVLVSKSGHYVRSNCADWSGPGIDNVREIPVDSHNRRQNHRQIKSIHPDRSCAPKETGPPASISS